MSYWCSIPQCIRLCKRLTEEEKSTYYALSERMNVKGYVDCPNAELQKELNISESALLARMAALEGKGFIARRLQPQNHKRVVYLRPPVASEEKKPTDEELIEKTKHMQNAYKKGIFFDLEPETLAERMLELNYLEDMTNHTIQFVLNLKEIKFLAEIMKMDKVIDCQLSLYRNIDIEKLLESIKKSTFLRENKNLSLKWCLENAERIISNEFKNYKMPEANKNFAERSYSDEMLNSMFQQLEEIEI